MAKKYKVYVDDNYHQMGESDRYLAGEFDSLIEAVKACENITIKSLEDLYEKGISPEKLSAQWAMFGDDPFIVGGEGALPFSAREFINADLCNRIIDRREARGWKRYSGFFRQ